MLATEPAEAAVAVVLEQLEVGEPVEKESKPGGTMRIRADTRRAPTRTGRRTLGAPLGLLCISQDIQSTELLGQGVQGIRARGNKSHRWLVPRRRREHTRDETQVYSSGARQIPKGYWVVGTFPWSLGPVPTTITRAFARLHRAFALLLGPLPCTVLAIG